MTRSKTGVAVEAVSYRYRNLRALDSLSFSLGPGIFALLGPNGAGKTTLLSLLATDRRIQDGSIEIAGHEIGTWSGRKAARPHLGMLPQRFSLVGAMTVADTVSYAAWAQGVREADAAEAANAAIERVGITALAGRRTRQLSGGQRQLVGVAAAISHSPRVLLLDEPTAGLDPTARVDLRRMLQSLGTGRTIVLSTHLIEDVTHLCQHVLVLGEGKLLFFGTPAQLGARAATSGQEMASPIEAGYTQVLAGAVDHGTQ